MSNKNNAPSRAGRGKRGRTGGEPPAQPSQKKQKTKPSGQSRKRAAKRGRAQAQRQALTGRGGTQNRSGYGNKAEMPIWESEYIAEVTPSAYPAFSLQQFPVNPGQAGCFPWLSRIAANFEKYEFEFLDFVYKREVSEFASNGQTGKVIMSFDSDATDSAPTTKQQMEDTDPHADCMPCENMRLSVPQDILRKFNDAHFVRPGAQPANTDLKTYDIGTLNVACQGTAANTAVGELHVEYALRLRVPILENVFQSSGVVVNATGTGTATATPLGTQANIAIGGNLVASATSAGVVTLQNLVIGSEYSVTTGGKGAASFTPAAYGSLVGLTLVNDFHDGATTPLSWMSTFTATATTGSFTVAVTIGTPPATGIIVSIAQVPSLGL